MKTNLFAAIVLVALAVPAAGNAQFGGLMSAVKPSANTGGDLSTQQDSLVRNYLAAGKDILVADRHLADALGLKVKAIDASTTSDSLSGKDVEAQDIAVSANNEAVVQALKSGATLKDSEAKATYAKGLLSMAVGMKKYLDLRKDAQGFTSGVTSASPLMIGKLQSGVLVAKNLPTSMSNLGSVLKSAVEFGRSNGVDIPERRDQRSVKAANGTNATGEWSMRSLGACLFAISVSMISACGKKDETPVAPVSANAPASAPPVAAAMPNAPPDFGGITKVSREVEAVGSTQELAVLAALQMAVAQVNGMRVATQMQNVRAELTSSVNGQSAGSVRSEGFAQRAISASQGAVIAFKILSQEEVDKLDEEAVSRVRASDGGFSYSASASSDRAVDVRGDGSASARVGTANAQQSSSFAGSASRSDKASVEANRGASSYESDATFRKMRTYWKMRVAVEVAQYRAPDEQGRPKIVVAMPRTLNADYPVGDANVASSEVARAVRGRLSDIITQTKRFIVLDREFGTEMQAEIDHIGSGAVRVQDSARIGQQLSTDLILIPTIERFEFPRHVQKLRMSDRELVSYSGGGRITLRLLNAATGEVVMSNTFEHDLASVDPSTMPRVIDGKSMATGMMNSLASQIGSAIVTEIFPVTVVSLSGDQAVLSQGGESLKVGERWLAVALGEDLKDPQTGRSLGRSELPIGKLRVDRVSGKLSYGTFEDGAPNLNGQPFKAGSIELRQASKAGPEAVALADKTIAQTSSPAKPSVRPQRTESQAETETTIVTTRAPAKDNDKNW